MFKFNEKQQWALDQFAKLSEELGSQNKAGERTGISSATISAIKSGNYKGNVTNQLNRLIDYFSTKEEAADTYTQNGYVKTSVSNSVYNIIKNCHLKGGLAISCGDAGIGKTQASKQYAKEHPNNCIYISVNPCIKSAKAVMKLIGNNLNVSATSLDEMWLCIVSKLNDGMVIIIDEAQHLGIKTIETLRSFTDYFDSKNQTLGICFVGNQETVTRLGGKQKAEFAQIRNRTKQTKVYTTKQITKKDMELLFPALVGKESELEFMLKIAHSQQAVRGAVNLFSNAKDNDNITLKGLVAMAKFMDMEV